MSKLPTTSIEYYCAFPPCLLPETAKNVFFARADNGNHFLDFGIHEGMMLIFDEDAAFVDGHPSCFVHKDTKQLKMLRHSDDDYEHAGKLIAAINYYGDD